MLRRRRPLLRGAAVAGGAYAWGKHSQKNAQKEADQEERISGLEEDAAAGSKGGSASAAQGSSDLTASLKELAGLRDSGVLNDEEFEAAKKKLLNG